MNNDSPLNSASNNRSLQHFCSSRLQQLEQQNLLRQLQPQPPSQSPDFASNDYLGLASHPAVIQALCEAAIVHGVGARSARLINANSLLHLELETQLANHKQKQAALLFPCGYMAALAAINPLCQSRDDVIFIDHLSHACLLDAARSSSATIRVFHHNDPNHLDKLLSKYPTTTSRKIIITEAIFSMDGDLCPLLEIIRIKEKHGAWLLLDEAHATGIIGHGGSGLATSLDVHDHVDIILGTLSKALGTTGGYLAGPSEYIRLLHSTARTFLFTTAPPPALAAATLAALQVCQSSEGDLLRLKLQENITLASQILKLPQTPSSPIIPLILGSEHRALVIAKHLRDTHHLALPAIRYPTVPRGRARLRVTINAKLTRQQITENLEKVHNAIKQDFSPPTSNKPLAQPLKP